MNNVSHFEKNPVSGKSFPLYYVYFTQISFATCIYRLVCPVDPDQEERLSDEKADAQVLVDGVAVTLQPTEEAEGEDADKQTHQGQQDAHPGDHIQEQVVHAVCFLWENTQNGRT